MSIDHRRLLNLTTEIVSSYAGHNVLAADQLSDLINRVHNTLVALESPAEAEQPAAEPAVPIKRSVKNNEIVCLECGRGQKMLKRHIATAHGHTPDEYRQKWNLRSNYPMVAPDYAKRRSEMAKRIGLGRTTKRRTKA
ncbi:MAG: MucR family transcriptional regulator [Inquilinus sp.]|nr:MucR family transcriptional regulator [Inquilinus sp.]